MALMMAKGTCGRAEGARRGLAWLLSHNTLLTSVSSISQELIGRSYYLFARLAV